MMNVPGQNAATAENIESLIAPFALGGTGTGTAIDPEGPNGKGTLYGATAQAWFTNPADAAAISNFDANFTTNDAEILGAAVIDASIEWCDDNIESFEDMNAVTQGQLTELSLNGDLVFTDTPGSLTSENGTKKQLFYDLNPVSGTPNWAAVSNDLHVLEGFTLNKQLLNIGLSLINDNATHL
jgi:hypothetical protein